MEPDQKVTFRKRIEDLWVLSQSYRAGFALGFLAVSLTLVLILTGQKSEKMSFKAQPRASVATVSSSPVKELPSETLGTSVAPAPIEQKNSVINKTNPSSNSTTSKKININTASAGLLESLPYIGPVMAGRIVDYRTSHGPFKSINELDNVKGIGPKTLEKFRNLVTVD